MITEELTLEIWERLIRGKSLEGLPLDSSDGRLNLKGLAAPAPEFVRRWNVGSVRLAESDNDFVFSGIKWRNLDFSGSRLNSFRFLQGHIANCIFNRCKCQDWRLWETSVIDTSFTASDLRKSALGGVRDGRRNSFERVDFAEADLRQTAYVAAAFHDCNFVNTKLVKVDFQTSEFRNCTFSGELEEVIFYHKGFKAEGLPANEMIDVDFAHATLRFVEFRGLNLDRVKLPEDANHIVVSDYLQVLERMIKLTEAHMDVASRKLTAYLKTLWKWAGPKQKQGVFNVQDVEEMCGKDGIARFKQLLRSVMT